MQNVEWLVDLAVSHAEGPIGHRDTSHDPIEHDMAPTPARTLLACLAVAALASGCTGDPDPRTGVADATAPPPSTAPSGRVAGTAPSPPDLSGNEIDCAQVDDPCGHGDDPTLDELWDACADGAGAACDRLYYDSGFDTRYEQFGNTCGDRGLTVPCPSELDD